MNDKHLFEPEEIPQGLAGIDAALLADLYDVVAKYGVDVAGAGGLRRLTFGSPKEMHVSVTVSPSRQRNILVSTMVGGANVTRSHMFLIRDGLASFVLWDRSYTVADVRAAIAALDADMDPTRDPLSGARRRMATESASSAKLSVDAVFAERGKAVMSSDGIDAEDLRRQFDRPDDLAVVSLPDGTRLLCRRRDAHGFDPVRREAAILRLLARHGIRTREELDGLTKEQLERFHAELTAEIFGDKN